jgi:hypothetical protein
VRWYLRPEERLPTPPVEEHDDRGPVLAGTVAWAVLALVAWLARDELAERGHDWWFWTAVSGVVLGLMGLWILHRRRTRGAED